LASRSDPAAMFGAPVLLSNVSRPSVYDASPWISGDGLRLVFASMNGPLSMTALFEATRPDRTVMFGAPVLLAPLDLDSSNEDTPTLSPDGLEIFFTSDRPGGTGQFDVYTSRRPALDQPFAAPQEVKVLDSALDEAGLRLSHDGATLYYNTQCN